jgi:ADP-ribose pyrophosphatase YjhB (NUDIX family)
LLAIAVGQYGAIAGLDDADVRARFAREVGCITPKVGTDAAIVDGDGRLLLVLRTDDRKWGLVAGWVDPNESPYETARREAREEVGLDIRVDGLADVIWRPASPQNGPHAAVSVVFLCSVVGGTLTPQPHEVIEARWWHVDDVPAWHLNHEQLARAALAARDGL